MIRRAWLGIFSGWLLLCSSAAISAPEKVVFGVMRLAFPPFQVLQSGQPAGPDLDTVIEAFRRMPDYELDIQVMPFKRARHEIYTGRIDVTTMYKTPDRIDKLLFPDTPIRWSIYKIAVPAGKRFEFNGIDDLAGRRFGKLEKVPVSQAFDVAAEEKKFELYELKSFKNMLEMLNLERLEAVVGHVQVIDYVAMTMDLRGRIEFLDEPVRPAKELHLAVSPQSKVSNPEALRKALSLSFKSMLDDGTYDAIYRAYGLTYEGL